MAWSEETKARARERRAANKAAKATVISINPPAPAEELLPKPKASAKDYQPILDLVGLAVGLVQLASGLDALFFPNRMEQQAILVPLLRILDRRYKLRGKINEDFEDATLAVIALIAYAQRVVTAVRVRRAVPIQDSRSYGAPLGAPHGGVSPNSGGNGAVPAHGLVDFAEQLFQRTAGPGDGAAPGGAPGAPGN